MIFRIVQLWRLAVKRCTNTGLGIQWCGNCMECLAWWNPGAQTYDWKQKVKLLWPQSGTSDLCNTHYINWRLILPGIVSFPFKFSSWACSRGTAPTGPMPPGVMSRTPGRFSLWRVAMAVWRPARSWARNKHKQPLRGSSAVALWQRRPSLRAAGGKVMWLGIMVSWMRRDGWLRVHLRPGSVEDVPISFKLYSMSPCTASMMLPEVCAIPNAGSVKLLADPFCEKHPMCAQALGGFVPKHGSKVVLFV